jgi:hypothetical protein
MKSWRFDRSDPMKSRAATDSEPIRNRVVGSGRTLVQCDRLPLHPKFCYGLQLWCYTRRIRGRARTSVRALLEAPASTIAARRVRRTK